MALEKTTVKIIAILGSVVIIVVLLGLLLGHLLREDQHIELEVWPRGPDGSAEPLISYKSYDRGSYRAWVQRIDDFFDDYRPRKKNGELRPGLENLFLCDYERPPPGDKVCDVDLRELHPCIAENNYNYHRGAPCVFLKLNKILNWTPMLYNTTEDLPKNMPEELKHTIKDKVGRPEANEAWVTCEGETPADQELMGPVRYIPRHGFPSYYLTSANRTGYFSPLVAVLFERPNTGIVINVVCKAWAKNIACEDCEQTASVHFYLLID